jgi:crotonobetainyl-CoA:carnitine CoA-transferase CaiB-like acyl-CoA transferase
MRKHALEGVRVVDFSWIVAGPTCTRILADFGAEVIRVENEQTMDYTRNSMAPPGANSPNMGGMFNNLNRNKLGVTINVMHPSGMELLHDLIAVSDIVVENFSATVLKRWGLDYEAQRQIRPDIIYASMSGFGHTGRDNRYVTWGPTAQALSGLTYMSGLPGEDPAGWGFSYMDHIAGYHGAIACITALHHRNRTGEGQWVDLSQVESGITLSGPAILDRTVNGRPYRREGNPPGNRAPEYGVAPQNSYRCKGDDRWCAISIFDEAQWSSFVEAIGAPEWTGDERFSSNEGRLANQDELDALIETWTINYTPHEVMHKLQSAGVIAGAVQNTKEKVDDDPQLRHRGYLAEVEHAELGLTAFEGEPIHLSRSPWDLKRAAPMLGEHDYFVFNEILGVEDEEMGELMAEGAI